MRAIQQNKLVKHRINSDLGIRTIETKYVFNFTSFNKEARFEFCKEGCCAVISCSSVPDWFVFVRGSEVLEPSVDP